MSVLDRYLTRHAMMAVTLVVAVLLCLISLFALFEELDESRVTYKFQDALSFVIKTMPRRLDEILVYGLFLGNLIALGRLAETHELTIMRVSGLSPTRIMVGLLPSMAIWLIISIFVAEYIAPPSERTASVEKMTAMYGDEALDHRGGLWLRTGELYMQVRAIDDDGTIHGITQYFTRNRILEEVVEAESGSYDPVAQQWNLLNGSRTRLSAEGARQETFMARTWNNAITPEVLAAQAFLEANKMSMVDLARQIDFARSQQLGVSEYELAFWSRVMKPATYLGLTLFALAVVLGPLRQVGMGLRLTFGVFAGLAFKYLQDLFAPAAIVFNIPAPIAILIPIVFYWAVALYLIRRSA